MNNAIAVIVSAFNQPITSALKTGTIEQLIKHGVLNENITVIDVPGAVEIPLVALRLAKQKKHAAIIALGAVIRGETTHYDYVCEQVSNGCQRVMLEHEVPVIFGILTTEDEQQAWDRLGGKHGHKGNDAADAAIHMVKVMKALA